MNIEEFRTYCLSFRGVSERMPFTKAKADYDRNLLVFYVLEKWFCFVNIDAFDKCTIRCHTDRIPMLQQQYDDILPAYHMNKKHWISIALNASVDDNAVRQLVADSYNLAVQSMTAKERSLLDTIRRYNL